MGRVFLGALLAAVVLFAWGFLYWVLSPLTFHFMKPMPGGESLPRLLKENIPEDGYYSYPWPQAEQEADQETLMRRHREGPLVYLTIVRQGEEPSYMVFVLGFLHYLVSAFVAGLLLSMALPGLPGYGARVLFIFGLGVFASMTIHVSDMIWMHHPVAFPLFSSGYVVGGWLLAGLVLALVVRPTTQTA